MNTTETATKGNTMLFKDQVKTMTGDELLNWIAEWKAIEHRAHAMRDPGGARRAGLALRMAWREQDRRR